VNAIVECENITKRYGKITAVNNVSLSIVEGEVFGLVGPNGAGKTTLIEIIEGLRSPDSGSVRLLEYNPTKDPDKVQEKIGVQLQTTSIQPNLKVNEAILLFASLYQQPLNDPNKLLKTLSLEEKANSRFRTLSGGQKQRLAIALALVNNPLVVFFDELSTGLDPQARRKMWALIEEIKGQGKTIFLTTHYMEEAQELCDRVGVIDYGKIIALDTPQNLITSLDADSKVTFRVEDRVVSATEFEKFPEVSQVEIIEDDFVLYTRDENTTIREIVRLADKQRFSLTGIRTEIPNMDDVFLKLTGRELRE